MSDMHEHIVSDYLTRIMREIFDYIDDGFVLCRRSYPRSSQVKLYVRFNIKEWTRLPRLVKPGGNFVYSHLFTTKYILDRAEELAELRLGTEEELSKWREKRRLGKVKVELDNEYVDKAERVLRVRVER